MTSQTPGIEELLQATTVLRATLERIPGTVIGSPSLSQALAVGALKRVANVLKAIHAVGQLRQPSEVNALGRVICETLYDCAWMKMRDSADRPPEECELKAQWLVDRATLEGYRILQEWVRHQHPARPTELEEARVRADKARARQHLKHNETLRRPNIWERAAEAGAPFAENYSLFYRRMCLDAHPTIQANLRALVGEGEDQLGEALFMAIASTLSVGEVCCSLLGRDNEFEPVRSEVFRIIESFATDQ